MQQISITMEVMRLRFSREKVRDLTRHLANRYAGDVIRQTIRVLDEVFYDTENIQEDICLPTNEFQAALENSERFFLRLAQILCHPGNVINWSVTNTLSSIAVNPSPGTIEHLPFANLTAYTWTFQGVQYRFQTLAAFGHTYQNPRLNWWFSKNMNSDDNPNYNTHPNTPSDTVPEWYAPNWVEIPTIQQQFPQFPQFQPNFQQRLLRLENCGNGYGNGYVNGYGNGYVNGYGRG
jgi:hypothetical protein